MLLHHMFRRAIKKKPSKNTNGNGVGCWYCCKPGHIKPVCFNRKRYKEKNDERNDTHDEAIVALSESDTSRK